MMRAMVIGNYFTVTETEMREVFRTSLINSGCLLAQASELAASLVNDTFRTWGSVNENDD